MEHGNLTDGELAELIGRAAEAASALIIIGGDIRTYVETSFRTQRTTR